MAFRSRKSRRGEVVNVRKEMVGNQRVKYFSCRSSDLADWEPLNLVQGCWKIIVGTSGYLGRNDSSTFEVRKRRVSGVCFWAEILGGVWLC